VNGRAGLTGKLALLGASLGVFALLAAGAELGLRLAPPRGLETAPALQPHVYSPEYGWALRRGFIGKTRDGRTVRINRRGFRGPEPEEGGPGRRRVLLLGDSLTFGTGVEDAETFASRLAAAAPSLEPLNLGVSGYGTDQELLLLEREGFALSPAAVVLNVCVGNDVFDNALPVYLYDGVTPKPYFTADGEALVLHDDHVRLRGPALLARHLVERSLAFDALLRLAGPPASAPLDHDDGEHWGPRARAVLERWPEAVALSRRIVARAERACRERGVTFLVLLHPNRRAFEGEEPRLEPFLTSPAGGPGGRAIDLRELYRHEGVTWSELALDRLGHLSPRGHRLVAELLARSLGE
jgi:lysophospholipase L1-like esterase